MEIGGSGTAIRPGNTQGTQQLTGPEPQPDAGQVNQNVTNRREETQAPGRPLGADRAGREAATARLQQDPAVAAQAARFQQQLGGEDGPATEVRANDTEVIAAAPPPPTHVNVPFYSQFEKGHGFIPGDTACLKASTAMAKTAGAHVAGPADRIQVARGENKDGTIKVDSPAAHAGQAYIDEQLAAGRPVVVGVSHKKGNYNVDKVTDHFVVITGKGTDDAGKPYYTFNDPGTTNRTRGADTNPNNRFYVDDNGMLFRDGAHARGPVTDRRYEVSMVRRNND